MKEEPIEKKTNNKSFRNKDVQGKNEDTDFRNYFSGLQKQFSELEFSPEEIDDAKAELISKIRNIELHKQSSVPAEFNTTSKDSDDFISEQKTRHYSFRSKYSGRFYKNLMKGAGIAAGFVILIAVSFVYLYWGGFSKSNKSFMSKSSTMLSGREDFEGVGSKADSPSKKLTDNCDNFADDDASFDPGPYDGCPVSEMEFAEKTETSDSEKDSGITSGTSSGITSGTTSGSSYSCSSDASGLEPVICFLESLGFGAEENIFRQKFIIYAGESILTFHEINDNESLLYLLYPEDSINEYGNYFEELINDATDFNYQITFCSGENSEKLIKYSESSGMNPESYYNLFVLKIQIER